MSELGSLFRRDITRLIQEVQAFPNDASLWEVRPGVTNSAGNLALHLEGNLREYIGRRLGNIDYKRDRPLEFSAKGVSQAALVARLTEVRDTIPGVIDGLSDAQWNAIFPDNILKIPASSRMVVYSLYGHLSYHLGQIDYLRRIVTNGGVVNFAGLD